MVNNGLIETGDVLLFNNHYKLANLIKKVLDSHYSHGAIVMYADEDFLENESCWVAESSAEGFIIKKYLREIIIGNEDVAGFRYKNSLSEGDKEFLKFAVVNHIGRKYDTFDLYRLFFLHVFKLNIRYENAKKLTCTEAVERCYRDIGKPLCTHLSPEDVTPKDLEKSEVLERVY